MFLLLHKFKIHPEIQKYYFGVLLFPCRPESYKRNRITRHHRNSPKKLTAHELVNCGNKT